MQQMAHYFHSYVGGVFLTKGQDALQAWISKLIEPDQDVQTPTGSATSTTRRTSQAEQQGSVGICRPFKSALTTFSGAVPSAGVSAAALNQIGMQQNVPINYVATQSGHPHDPTWTVRCLGKRLRFISPGIQWT